MGVPRATTPSDSDRRPDAHGTAQAPRPCSGTGGYKPVRRRMGNVSARSSLHLPPIPAQQSGAEAHKVLLPHQISIADQQVEQLAKYFRPFPVVADFAAEPEFERCDLDAISIG